VRRSLIIRVVMSSKQQELTESSPMIIEVPTPCNVLFSPYLSMIDRMVMARMQVNSIAR
jgi:UDP-N-acetyl-D-mannosaminuronate dehydrogenase